MKISHRKKLNILTACILLAIALSVSNGFTAMADDNTRQAANEDDLRTAISAVPADGSLHKIELTGDIYLETPLLIEEGKNIQVYSDSKLPVTLTSDNRRHFETEGSLTLNHIILDGGHAGGGVFVNQGELILNEGSVITNCKALKEGGGVNVNQGSVHINGGSIIGNSAGLSGGGLYAANASSITLSAGSIEENRLSDDYGRGGGGINISDADSTFIMSGGKITNNETYLKGEASSTAGGGVALSGTFYLKDGIISENRATHSGGGVSIVSSGHLIMQGGIISGNTAATESSYAAVGGGVAVEGRGRFTMDDGLLEDNAADYGGGIYAGYPGASVTVHVKEGTIRKNSATLYGGGIFARWPLTVVNLDGGTIGGESPEDANSAAFGGGLFLIQATANLKNSNIIGNYASHNGGGIYLQDDASLNADDGVSFINNRAGNEGGGIYTTKFNVYSETMNPFDDYTDLTLEDTTVFSGNTASALYTPPDNAADFTNLAFAKVSLPDLAPHPLNNYDINFVLESDVIKTSDIIYNANDGSTDPKTVQFTIASGSSHKVRGNSDPEIGFIRKDYTFAGWNDKSDGKGTEYKAAAEITHITQDIILYAQWKKNDGGGSGSGGGGNGGGNGGNGGGDIDVDEIYYYPDTILNKEDHMAYVVGYPDDTVRPNANITRAETTSIFFRLLTDSARSNYLSKTNSFTDVHNSTWYNTAVSTMSNANIIEGYNDGTFGGDKFITRAEFATIASQFDSSSYTGNDKFPDINGHWATEYINRASEKGWISGYGDGTFKPDQYITRAEAITLINRVLERDKNLEMHPDMAIWPDNPPVQWYYMDIQEAANSHLYDRNSDGYEIWTQVLPAPNWADIEN